MTDREHAIFNAMKPVYTALSVIQKLAVVGFISGRSETFIDIRKEAEEAMGDFAMAEKEFYGTSALPSDRVKGTGWK